MDIEANYNVLCYEYATAAVKEDHPSKLPYPGSCAILEMNDRWTTRNLEQKLTEASTSPAIREYIIGKFKWGQKEYERID